MEEIIITTTDPAQMKSIITGIIRRELAEVEHGIEKTHTRLESFEQKYNMSTAEFLRRFTHEDLGETLDFIEWDGEVKTLKLLEEKRELWKGAWIV